MAKTKKLKGKIWFTVVSPKYFGEKVIGETPGSDEKSVIGRRMEVAAMNITNNYSKYYIKFWFKINKVNGDKAYTVFDGFECLQDYISRMIRRRTKRIDTIQDVRTKDGIKLRVKSIAITNRVVKSSVIDSLRNFIRDVIKKDVENSELDEFIESIINDKLKNKILVEGSKIYPLRYFEIRRTDVLS